MFLSHVSWAFGVLEEINVVGVVEDSCLLNADCNMLNLSNAFSIIDASRARIM